MTKILSIVFIVYLLIINLTAFALMGIDKRRAIKGQWRIPEKTLFITAILLGSIGANIGMKVFRHKTKRLSFVLGMPAILIIQSVIAFLLTL